ncbi:DUF6387 family protein [Neptunomonas sp.]|uniref:DUF6387 family protein n=1 Tax=Neptunomonas sp. TaxID=1971898 RepID=UPI0025D568AA|nr:DUF6387 family protein [Neptunomonas sp.]
MKRVTKLPEWFDLTKYSPCRSFDDKEWLRQLTYRSDALQDLKFDNEITYSLSETEEIRLNALPSKEWQNQRDNLSEATVLPHGIDFVKYSHFRELANEAITPLSTLWMLSIGQSLDCRHQSKSFSKEKLESIKNHEPYDLHRKQENEYFFEDEAFVQIDLSLPDGEIIKCLKSFLPKYRKFLNISTITKRPSDTTLALCANYEVLPYLDLYIWEIENQLKIKRSILAVNIYPEGHIGEQGISQTVHPFAINVTDPSFLRALKSRINRT